MAILILSLKIVLPVKTDSHICGPMGEVILHNRRQWSEKDPTKRTRDINFMGPKKVSCYLANKVGE